ncbi:MAG: dipeptide epimerase [Bacteroidetes bacterium]|nr:dipeptide epimerase [Bacteroidota bacterium]
MQLNYSTIDIPFKHPFTISGGRSKTNQRSLVVGLTLGTFTGYGEAPEISYYPISIEQMIQDLENRKGFVEKFALIDPARYWHYLHHLYPENPFLVCALDMAAWDLFGQMKGMPLYQIWNTKWEKTPPTDFTIGLAPIEDMIRKMKEMPWPVYKIKLGHENDLEIITALRKETDALIRVDVNGGWTLKEARDKIPRLKALGVEFIEQPLPKDAWKEMKLLYAESSLPLYADESCVTEDDVQKCEGHFHGINIKLTKCSGITPALRMIKQAQKLNLKVMMGSMNESVIGSVAVAHFLPQVHAADIDGPLLQESENAKGIRYEYGRVHLSNHPGLGVLINPKVFQ